ncbi:hypothetical protein [Sphaerisporangium aureirubrum]|uniref:Uncharacterized protein n=1 Tax=Sphaerisporangium aureirubrum TaxID=1544736 RepID=A0ABW1NIL2_9ACTN
MRAVADQDLVRQVARDVVAVTAPEELPLVRPMADEFFRGGRGPARGKEDLLGFGVDTAVVLLTPVVLPVIAFVLDALGERLAEAAVDRGAEQARRVLRAVLRRGTAAELAAAGDPAPLTGAQLDTVRATAYEKACQLGLEAPKADLLADAVRGALSGA